MSFLTRRLSERYHKARIRVVFVEFILKHACGINGMISGSRAEGPHSFESDTDFMYISKDMEVFQCIPDKLDDMKANFLIETGCVYPGYAKLFLLDRGCRNLQLLPEGGDISPLLCKQSQYLSTQSILGRCQALFLKLLPELGLLKQKRYHGPCIQQTYRHLGNHFDLDYLYCIPCNDWPLAASEWISRCRPHGWPSKDLIGSIVSRGHFHIPIGRSRTETDDKEWRLSFSLAEKELIYSFNGPQITCLDILKSLHSILKRKYPGGIESYIWKTSLLWTVENTARTLWTDKHVLDQVVACVQWVVRSIKDKLCPNYFIPANNMLDDKHADPVLEADLLSYLEEISRRSHPLWKDMILTKANDCRDDLLFKYHIFFNTLSVARLSILSGCSSCSKKDVHRYIDRMINLLNTDQSQDETLRAHLLIFSESYRESLNMSDIMNSEEYASPKAASDLQLLLKACDLDVCSGWLKLATVKYQLEDLLGALMIIDNVLSNYGPHVVYYTSFSVIRDQSFAEYPTDERMTISEFSKKYIMYAVMFLHEEMNVVPNPVRYQFCNGGVLSLNPIFYAHFLQFLILCQLGRFEESKSALQEMQNFQNDSSKLETATETLELLAQCYILLEDNIAALGCLAQLVKRGDASVSVYWQLCALLGKIVSSND
ncbi:hypothetical protein CHS0354_021107 [Potamilus streckersoni]|nr:hypothetical protein CHS0354_021107 [Potamilus streckersoni]